MRAMLVAVCALVATLTAVRAQSPQQPTFRGGVDVVAVDVHVVDGAGRPVADLKPGDFTITVDGKARTIVAADYVSHPVATATAPAVAPSAPVAPLFTSNRAVEKSAPGRTIVIVVDQENIAAGSGRFAIDAIGSFMDQLQPNDRVGLAVLTRGQVAIDPTTDRAVVRKALTGILGRYVRADAGSSQLLGQVEAFSFEHDKKGLWGEVVTRECYSLYSGSDPRLPACIAEMEKNARAIMADSRRRQVDSMRALIALFNSLAQVSGPKLVVLLSQQLPVAPYLAERTDFNSEARRLAQAAAGARTSVYVLHLDTPMIDMEQGRQSNIGSASNAASAADKDMASLGLETVTTVTGGRRMMISGKPEGAFTRMALEISGYYLLGFRSEATDRDGKPHEIKVKVNRGGVDLRARQWFTYATEAQPSDKTATDTVNRLLRAPDAATDIALSVTTYALKEPGGDAASGARMRVLISAEVDRAAAPDGVLAVGYTLTDAAGKNAGASVEQLTLKPAEGDPNAPLCWVAAGTVLSGSYTLRLAVAQGPLHGGSVTHRFDAQPTAAGPLTMSDLVVFDRYSSEGGKPRPSVSAAVAGVLSGYIEGYVSPAAAAPSDLAVRLEIADTPDGPARATGNMELQGPDANGRLQISGVVDAMALPAGTYVARAVPTSGGKALGRVTRPISLVQPAKTTPGPPAAPSQPPAAAAASTLRPTPGAPATSVEGVMSRAADYIDEYAEKMSLVIGIEHYGQWFQREEAAASATLYGGTTPASSARAISRQTVAEFALIHIGDSWDGFRNVYEVDGKPVPDAKDRLQKLFAQPSASTIDQSRKVAAESSKYNMGGMQRNFNVPTVALFFLGRTNQGRFKFKKDKDENVNGVAVWKVKFEETQKPTIIRTSAGKDMPVKGEVWVDPVDGRVWKTHMQIDSEMTIAASAQSVETAMGRGGTGTRGTMSGRQTVKTTASITVTYAAEPRLGLLVPGEMLETYEAPMRNQFSGEDVPTKINCRATYSDFKRFETGARIVK